MSQDIVTPKQTLNIMTELVLPNDTNLLGNLMGGRLMYWMDIAAAISAMRLSNHPVVTASVDNVSFQNPVKLGNVLRIESFVSRSFNTSMEVYLEVYTEDMITKEKNLSNKAFYTFVALDSHGKPSPVEQVVPETDKEKELYAGALRRRQLRLVLAGKMKADDAVELKSIFSTP